METDKSTKDSQCNNPKNIENELKEYQAKFRTLFNNVSSGVAIYEARNDGEDFIFVDFNTAAEEIEHIKKDKLIDLVNGKYFSGQRNVKDNQHIEAMNYLKENNYFLPIDVDNIPLDEEFKMWVYWPNKK